MPSSAKNKLAELAEHLVSEGREVLSTEWVQKGMLGTLEGIKTVIERDLLITVEDLVMAEAFDDRQNRNLLYGQCLGRCEAPKRTLIVQWIDLTHRLGITKLPWIRVPIHRCL